MAWRQAPEVNGEVKKIELWRLLALTHGFSDIAVLLTLPSPRVYVFSTRFSDEEVRGSKCRLRGRCRFDCVR
jgi:hypothetical protein